MTRGDAVGSLSSTPVVSVIVPTHNRLPYLKEAVVSVRSQTFREWELIVVDDGSTDGTTVWVNGLHDSRIRLLSLEHSGRLGVLRNLGAGVARGDLLAFLDSDDVWEPDKLELQVAAHRAHPDRGWSYTHYTRIDAEGRQIVDPGIQSWRPMEGWILEELLRVEALVPTPTVMVRTPLLWQVGGFHEEIRWVGDYELWFRLAEASPVLAVPERLTRIRVHPTSWTADRAAVHRTWVRVYGEVGDRVRETRLRRLCRRQAARHRYRLAGRLLDEGRRREAADQWLRAAHTLPVAPEGWRIGLRLLFRGLKPKLGATEHTQSDEGPNTGNSGVRR